MKFFWILPSFFFLALTGCWRDIEDIVDLQNFDEVSEMDLYEYLNPEPHFGFFEFRVAFCDDYEYAALYTCGVKCSGVPDSLSCISAIDSLVPVGYGFANDCRPLCCGHYVVAQAEGSNFIFETTTDLRSFLGKIDSKSDALMYIFSEGYYYSYGEKENSAIKETDDGYLVIAQKLISDCNPLQVDKFLLEVNHSGDLIVRKQRVLSKSNHCI